MNWSSLLALSIEKRLCINYSISKANFLIILHSHLDVICSCLVGILHHVSIVVWTWAIFAKYAYTPKPYSQKINSCCKLGWSKHLGRVFARVGSIFPECHAYGHKEFVHCASLWHITLCTHLQFDLPTSVMEIMVEGLCLSPTWGA